jgi:hypothetical protein
MSDKTNNPKSKQRVKLFQAAVLGAILAVGSFMVFSKGSGVGPGRGMVMAGEPAATQPVSNVLPVGPAKSASEPAVKSAPPSALAASTQPSGAADGKPQSVSFNELAGFRLKFKYTMSEAGERMITPGSVNPQIPVNVKELSGKKVAVRGYLLPIEYDAGKSTRFILMKYTPECLYCNSPTLCDWVDSTSKDGVAVPRSTQMPVEVVGTLEVGEKLEDGLITSVYQMKVDSVELVKPESMPPLPAIPGGVAPGHATGHGR